MERLGETKKRTGDDQPWKKRKHTPNETMDYLREATEMECKLNKEELEFRKKQEERALAQQNLVFQQQQEMSTQFQDQLKNQSNNSSSRWCVKCLWSNDNNKAKHYLNSWKRDIEFTKLIFLLFLLHIQSFAAYV